MKSLQSSNPEFASPEYQLELLNPETHKPGHIPFDRKLKKFGLNPLKPGKIKVFQVNVGYMCNQTCKHCHVDAGPDRKEIMSRNTMKLCLDKLSEFGAKTVDITGGAPELNPDFRWFVEQLGKSRVEEIIVRSNLTIILSNPRFHGLPEFFRDHKLRIVSSLPYYKAAKTDNQRGKGVFAKSIEALKLLNNAGYGTELILDLVYNPSGAFLPGNQDDLQRQFKKTLLEEHGIVFNSLFALTNLPINRYLDYLIASGNYEDYMEKLVSSFNPAAVESLMCRNTISIDYRGFVYDCDFNQMLDLPIENQAGQHLSEITINDLKSRNIVTGQYCYGCTAGAGSSCQGTLV